MSFALYVILISSCVAYLLVLTSKSTGWLKLFAVLLLMHGYITGVTTLREVSGYPTVSKLPKEFEVIYGRIPHRPNAVLYRICQYRDAR